LLCRLAVWPGRETAAVGQFFDALGELAEQLTRLSADRAVGVWPRTSAFLARQAPERAIAARWKALPETAAVANCSMQSQLVCLPF
jgi:hypothetical protein